MTLSFILQKTITVNSLTDLGRAQRSVDATGTGYINISGGRVL
jgi:hypothetical protein